MTKQELIEMVGSETQADLALNILLKNCKAPFLRMAINAELAEINEKINAFKADGIIYECNGSMHVNWCAPDKVYGDEPGAAWSATEEQIAQADAIKEKCYDADRLLYMRNRTVSLLAAR